jgi:hypothetical protein
MLITGKKRQKGSHLDQYTNDGDYSAATLEKLGFDPDKICVIVVEDDITKDRTYASAKAVYNWICENGKTGKSFNLVTYDCHSRRSRLLFRKAFRSEINFGVIAVENRAYNPGTWWLSSTGFREVVQETIAWFYARFFFCT